MASAFISILENKMRALIARLKTYFAHDVAIQRLNGLDDHLLADMGIARDEIEQRVRTPESGPRRHDMALPASAPRRQVQPMLNPQRAC